MIHQFKRNGYNIVLDVNSGSVHSVDEVAYEIIALYETHDREAIVRMILERFRDRPDVTGAEIREVFDDLETLRKRNQLLPRIPTPP